MLQQRSHSIEASKEEKALSHRTRYRCALSSPAFGLEGATIYTIFLDVVRCNWLLAQGDVPLKLKDSLYVSHKTTLGTFYTRTIG